jgi:hypothetical protein
MLAKQWFKCIEIVTDSAGADFIKQIGIPADSIIIRLDEINHIRPELWAYGKMATYAMQNEPFLHLDYDVYLLKRPDAVFDSQVITQNPESVKEYYYDDRIKFFDANFKNLPEEWKSFRKNKNQIAYNVGIIGGRNFRALRQYAEKGMKMIADNLHLINSMTDKLKVNDFNIVYEQYFLAAYMNYHNVNVDTLIPHMGDNNRAENGYEHFIGSAKGHLPNVKRMERFLFRHFPNVKQKLKGLRTELN